MAGAPQLSVVTRTRGRAVLLARAARHLAVALPPASEWIIVCDDPEPDDTILPMTETAGLPADTTVRIVQAGGVGRAEAFNLGIQAATGALIHFHDDDDTVEPAFYAETVSYLDGRPEVGAVVTWVERREESVENGVVRQLSATPHNPGLRTVTFAKLASACIFPPIAFVARREDVVAAGPFDRTLDVAEDYDFFLRFLCRRDIGVLTRQLCAVHVRRPDAQAGDLANSASSWNYEEVDTFYRNARFRRDLERGEVGLGWLLVIGELARSTSRLEAIFHRLRRLPFSNVMRKLFR